MFLKEYSGRLHRNRVATGIRRRERRKRKRKRGGDKEGRIIIEARDASK